VNLFVGGFIGSPAMNLVEATLERRNGGLAAAVGDQHVALDDQVLSTRPALKSFEGRKVVLGVRPEHLEDAALAPNASGDKRLRGQIELTEALGSELMVHFTVNAPPALTEDVKELAADVGEDALAGLEEARAEQQTTIVGRFSVESRVKDGETAEVAVDTRALHFFDPDSGLGIYDQTKGDTQ
jgi:multiple sugar transport system ATP-binding protein